jgi:hypothetical protein
MIPFVVGSRNFRCWKVVAPSESDDTAPKWYFSVFTNPQQRNPIAMADNYVSG